MIHREAERASRRIKQPVARCTRGAGGGAGGGGGRAGAGAGAGGGALPAIDVLEARSSARTSPTHAVAKSRSEAHLNYVYMHDHHSAEVPLLGGAVLSRKFQDSLSIHLSEMPIT
jgi:hypothetical protein